MNRPDFYVPPSRTRLALAAVGEFVGFAVVLAATVAALVVICGALSR